MATLTHLEEEYLQSTEKPHLCVGYPVTFKEYIAREWLGKTEVADRIRKVSYFKFVHFIISENTDCVVL